MIYRSIKTLFVVLNIPPAINLQYSIVVLSLERDERTRVQDRIILSSTCAVPQAVGDTGPSQSSRSEDNLGLVYRNRTNDRRVRNMDCFIMIQNRPPFHWGSLLVDSGFSLMLVFFSWHSSTRYDYSPSQEWRLNKSSLRWRVVIYIYIVLLCSNLECCRI